MTPPHPPASALLPNQRHLFDIPDDVAFLNCAYMSPLPKVAIAAGEQGLGRKAQPWTVAPGDFFAGSETVRARFAALINAQPDDIAFAPAVVLWDGAGGRQHRTRKDADDRHGWPSSFPLTSIRGWILPSATGARFVTVPRPADDDWTAAVLDLIDSATGVVALTALSLDRRRID